jgi:hypothetical protein
VVARGGVKPGHFRGRTFSKSDSKIRGGDLRSAIANKFGDFPLAALADRKARGEFMEWRDGLAKRSRRQADYAWSVLARVLSWELDRRLIDANPCEKGGRLYNASRSDRVRSDEDETTFMRVACGSL